MLEAVSRKREATVVQLGRDGVKLADDPEYRGNMPRFKSTCSGFQQCNFSKLQFPHPREKTRCFTCFGVTDRVKWFDVHHKLGNCCAD